MVKYEISEGFLVKTIFGFKSKQLALVDIESWMEVENSLERGPIWKELTLFGSDVKMCIRSSHKNYPQLKEILTKGKPYNTYQERVFHYKQGMQGVFGTFLAATIHFLAFGQMIYIHLIAKTGPPEDTKYVYFFLAVGLMLIFIGFYLLSQVKKPHRKD